MTLTATGAKKYECQTNQLQYGKGLNLLSSSLDSQRNPPQKAHSD